MYYLFQILFISIIILLMNIIKINKSSMFTGFLFGTIIYYFVVPMIVSFFENEIQFQKSVVQNFFWLSKSNEEVLTTSFSIFIFVIIFIISYFIFKKNNNRNMALNVTKYNKILEITGYFSLIVGGFCLGIVFYYLGGLSSALRVSEALRSFNSSLSEYVPYRISLLIVPARLITLAPICFILLYLNKNRKIYLINFIISFFITTLFFLYNSGRAPLITYLMYFLIPIMEKKIKISWSLIIFVGVIALPMLNILDSFFLYFETGVFNVKEFQVVDVLRQFSYPFKNSIFSNDLINYSGIRYGKDFITDFLSFIPGVNFDVSYMATSEFFQGYNWKILGGIPTDVYTYSKLQFGKYLFVLFPFILGFLFSYIDSKVMVMKDNYSRKLILTILTIDSFFIVSAADLQPILRKYILIFIMLLIVVSTKKVRKENKNT